MKGEMLTIEAVAPLHPTELKQNVVKAILNVVPGSEDDVVMKGGKPELLMIQKTGHRAMLKVHRALRREKILDTVRSFLISSLKTKGEMELLLHKQAAYSGQLRPCSSDEESPMGAIRLRFSFRGDPFHFLDWLAPKTQRGRVVKEMSVEELLAEGHVDVH